MRLTTTYIRNESFHARPPLRCGQFGCILLAAMLLAACGPSDKQKAERAEARRIECLDTWCEGDVEPKHDLLNETTLKLGGRWFVGPRRYFSRGSNGGGFYWPDKWPMFASRDPPSVGKSPPFDEIAIEILLRSTDFPPPPHGYAFIELAQRNDWIAERRTLRPDLEVVRMKSVLGPQGHSINHVTYYIATRLVGPDGAPPVAGCSHDDPRNGGGSGFMWKPGIWAGIRMNQRQCADWPEIYQEITRVMQLLREAT